MKRHLSLVVSLLVLVAMVFTVVSCDLVPDAGKKHEHTFSDKWSYDATNHWHAATCDDNDACKSEKADVAAHTLSGDTCSVCGYKKPADPKPEQPEQPEQPKADGSKEKPFAITVPGTAKVSVPADGEVYYTFTIAEDKTLKISFDSANVSVACAASVDQITANSFYNVGDAKVLETDLVAGTYYVAFATANFAAEEYNVTAEFITKVSPYETVLGEGRNNVVFSPAEITANTATRKLVINTASTYQFDSDLFVATVTAADGTAVEKVNNAFTLAAGEYTVTFGMFSNFAIEADVDISVKVEDLNAEDEDEEGDIVGTSDFIIGENSVTLTDEEATDGKAFTFIAYAAGTYTFASEDLLAIISDSTGVQIGRYEVSLVAGTYTVTLVNLNEVGGDFTLDVSYVPATGGGDDEDSEENPTEITLPAADLATNPDSVNFAWYTFTTTQPGKITITFSNDNSWARIYNVDDAEDSNTAGEKQVITFKVKANSTYKLGLGVWEAEEDVTASVTFEYVEPGALAEKGDMYSDEETTFDVTADDITAGGFTVIFYSVNAGEYNIYSNDLLVGTVTTEDGTVIERNDNWYFELEAYTAYIITFSTEYVSDAGSYTATAEYQYPEGHENNPIFIWELGDSVTATYKGDYNAVWYSFYASANGVVTITTADTAATIMFKPVGGMDITNSVDGEWTGSVTLNVMKGRQYLIGVIDSNWSTEARDIVFTPTLTEGDYVGDGSMNNPSVAVDGSNVANTPGSENVYFVYTATSNGVLTLTTDSATCSWAVATEFGNWEHTTGTLTIALEMDQKVYIAIATSDYQPAEVTFNASFKADPEEVYFEGTVVNDGSAANEFVIEENTWLSFSFGGAGQYVITWDNAEAKVELVAWGMANTVLASGDVIDGSPYGVNFIVYFEDYAAGTVNVTITPYAEESDASLVLGENTITVQDTQMGDTYNLPVNADETVTYVLTVGANAVIITNSGDIYMDAGETVEITVPAGETVSVGIGAFLANDPTAIVTVAVKSSTEGGENEGGNTPAGPTGTASDPFIVDTIPGEVKVTGNHDVYIKFTASKDCVLEFTYPAGCYIYEGMPSYMTRPDLSAKVYKGEVKAGDTFTLNVYTTSAEKVEYVYSFKEILPPTEVAGTIQNLGDNTFTLEENSYVLIPLQVMGLYQLTWTDSNIVVEFKENGMAPSYVQISSGAVASLNPMAGASLKVYLKDYAAGTATINVAEYVATPTNLVVGNNTVNVIDTTNGAVANLPVSDTEVTYVVTPGAGAIVITSDGSLYYGDDGETVEITVAANDAVSFNVGAFTAGEVAVNVAVKGAAAPSTPDVVAATYLAVHSGGRKLQVTVNADNTIVITRSDMTGNFTGGATTENATWAIVDGVFTVSGTTNAKNMSFEANGAPVSITWGTQVFENFEIQE